MSELEQARDHYLARLAAREGLVAARDPAWLQALRRQARESFAERGLPSTRLEEWRYTSLSSLARIPFEAAAPGPAGVDRGRVEALSFPVFACSLFVFVNGRHQAALSAPRATTGDLPLASLAQLRAQDPGRLEPHLGRIADPKQLAFTALNTAFLDDGAVIQIQPGAQLEQPIHLVFVSTNGRGPSFSMPRVLIVAGRGSRATVIQDHVSLGKGACFTNAVTEVALEPGAALELALVQRESDESFHVSNLAVRQERDTRFTAHTLSLGAALVRNDLSVLLADEAAECELNGLFVGTRAGTLDNHTLVDHAMPHGTSRELYKGILADRSHGVFRGRVIVRPDAQKSDARQSNPNLLLSDGAEIDTKPQLEIHADDVKCSHGSSIGRIDEDALFYLRSRGLEASRARSLLTRGFAAEVLAKLSVPSLGEALGELLTQRLDAAAQRP